MKHPNFEEEKKLWKKGFKFVAGLDEAGRGPLAGPVVAAAVCINSKEPYGEQATKIENSKTIPNFKFEIEPYGEQAIKQVKDSKKLSAKKRKEIYKILINHPDIKWGIGIVSEKVIDKINILEATKLAMQKAVKNLDADFLLIDGNFKIISACLPAGRQKSIIKGDQKVFSIAAASIIAKVTRDRIMQKFHKKYPQYGFGRHKGYGTKAHFASLLEFGPCKIHRRTFWPVYRVK